MAQTTAAALASPPPPPSSLLDFHYWVEVKPITVFLGSRESVFFCCELVVVVVAELLASCGACVRLRMLRMSGLFIF